MLPQLSCKQFAMPAKKEQKKGIELEEISLEMNTSYRKVIQLFVTTSH